MSLALLAAACSEDLHASTATANGVPSTTPTNSAVVESPIAESTTVTELVTSTVPVGPTNNASSTPAATTTTVAQAAGPTLPSSPTLAAPAYPNLDTAVYLLALDNVGVSVSVLRNGVKPWSRAAGFRVDRQPITSDTSFVIASVSKLVTALTLARLVERGYANADDSVPWDAMNVVRDPSWDDVTIRELLDHTSGMPINRNSWLDDPAPCTVPLAEAMAAPPTDARGQWQYSNGNYCALGLVIEYLTGMPLDEAAYMFVFGPAAIEGPYLTTDGLHPDSAPSPRGVARLARLGGAGTWMASSDDLAQMMSSVTADDLTVLRWPGIIGDQYGWGHTGTVDGAKACAWVMEDGRTRIGAVVSGPKPATGGDVCDAVINALALDLGIWAGDPIRDPL
jgi:D-alanyl-D-alanine carboxypeptidase